MIDDFAGNVTAARTAVVTGANSGIGLETARGLARDGVRVVLLCRSKTRAEAARADIEATVHQASVSILVCDLGLQTDVRLAAEQILATHQRLDILVNNAAIMLRSRELNSEGVDAMLAVNHVGPFLLTQLLLPLLQRSAPARIVNVASQAHAWGKVNVADLQAERGYRLLGFPRYFETKLMNILFTRELARRIDGTGVTVTSLHPGEVTTKLGDPPAIVRRLLNRLTTDATIGAETTLAAATDPEYQGLNGYYFVDAKPANHRLSARALEDDTAARPWSATDSLLQRTEDPST